MWALVWSPVRFFEERLRRPPRWQLAVAIPFLCGVLDMTALLLLGGKNQAAIQDALPAGLPAGVMAATKMTAVLSVVGFPLYFVLTGMMLASADVLFRDSRRQARLLEFAGLAFSAFLPVCLFMLAIGMLWTPPRVDALAPGMDLQAALTRYLGLLRSDPWLSTAGVLYYACLAWCAALLGVIMRVVSGFSRVGASAGAAAIFVSLSGFWR